MDILAHYLWTFAVYWKHPKRWLAGFVGFLPDMLSFGLFMVYGVVTGTRAVGHMDPAAVPQWVHLAYNLTHSLVILALIAVIVWLLWRAAFVFLGAWLLHILLDIFSHSDRFFPTPILWPISDFHLSGVSWGTWWFMLLNYGALIVVYTWLILKVPGPLPLRRKRGSQTKKNSSRRTH